MSDLDPDGWWSPSATPSPQPTRRKREARPQRPRREVVWKRDGGRCRECRCKCTREHGPRQGTLDHVIPKSRGGSNAVRNLQLLCRTCNERKGNKLPGWVDPTRHTGADPYEKVCAVINGYQSKEERVEVPNGLRTLTTRELTELRSGLREQADRARRDSMRTVIALINEVDAVLAERHQPSRRR